MPGEELHDQDPAPAREAVGVPEVISSRDDQAPMIGGLEDALLLVLMVALTAIMGLSVVGRSLTTVAISYIDQLLPDIFVWLSILGAASVARTGGHIGMTALVDRLPRRGRQAAAVFGALCAVVFFGTLAWAGGEIVAQQLRLGSRAAFGYPAWVIAVAIPVGSVIAIIRIVQYTLEALRGELLEHDEVVL